MGKDRQYLVVGAAVQIPAHMLFHISDAAFPCLVNFAAVAGHVAGENFKKGGFAGTVGSHQADVIPFLYFKRSPCKNQVCTKGFLQLADAEQCHGISSPSR